MNDLGYPVDLNVERPPRFQRAHVFLRIALLIVFGWIAHPVGVLWFGIPVVVAIVIAQKGGRRFVDDDGPTAVRTLNWVVDVAAYIMLLTARLRASGEHPVRLEVHRAGSPTVGSALLRILSVIPNLFVLAILTFFGSIAWVIAAVSVVMTETYPVRIWRFLLGIVRWEARVLAYLASLVDRYPPFALETEPTSAAASSAG